jgi:hypothetical protein
MSKKPYASFMHVNLFSRVVQSSKNYSAGQKFRLIKEAWKKP